MTDFPDIVLSAGKSKKRGQVSLTGSSPADCKIVFSPKSKPIEILLSSIEALHWVEVGATLGEGGFVLKLSPKSGNFLKFSGFQAAAYGAINAWCSAGGKDLEIEKVSTRGANWGKLIVDNHRMKFEDKDKFLVFDMPVQAVSQTVVQGKSEIGIEFPQDDDPKSLASQMETLCEIRIFVPNDEREKELAAKEKEKEAAAAAREAALANGEEVPPIVKLEGEDGEDPDADDDGGEEAETAAQLMVKDLQSRTGANDSAIQPIARFQLMFQSPRGKYSVDLFPTYLKLHSKTFQYKILYKFIQKMFLFANPGTAQHYFVIGLNPPVRQGRTAYPYLLVQFDDKEEMEEQFNIDAETCATKYKDVMEPTMRGPAHDVVTRVFKALTERKVLVPGNQFQSKHGGACIRCNLKAQDGYLYVMEKSFFFVKKPLLHLRHTDITEVMFRRVNSSAAGNKSFDVHIITNEEKNNEYIFSSIQKDEYQGLFDFLRTKKLTISSDATHGSLTAGASGRMRVAANYDEETDQHLNNINAELGGDDEDSEDDEDFEGKSSSSSSESGSDMAEEGSDSDEAPVQKKRSKGKSHGSDDDSDGGKKKSKEGGKKRKRGADKADSGPKRPSAKSAYFHYLAEARPKYVADHPEQKSNMIAVTGALAQQWKELDAATRAVYQKMSDDEKARIAAEYPEVEGAPKAAGKKRGPKKDRGPTKPPTPLNLFMSESKAAKKAAEPSLSATEVVAALREEWKGMGEEEQQSWKERVLVLQRQYKIDKAAWDEEHPAAAEDGDDEADGAAAAGGDDDAPMAASSAASSKDKGKKKDKEKKKKHKEKKEKKEKKNKKDKKKKKKDDAGSDASDDDMADEPAVKEEMED